MRSMSRVDDVSVVTRRRVYKACRRPRGLHLTRRRPYRRPWTEGQVSGAARPGPAGPSPLGLNAARPQRRPRFTAAIVVVVNTSSVRPSVCLSVHLSAPSTDPVVVARSSPRDVVATVKRFLASRQRSLEPVFSPRPRTDRGHASCQ